MVHFTITLEFTKYGLTLYRWGRNVSGKNVLWRLVMMGMKPCRDWC